VGKSSAIRSAN